LPHSPVARWEEDDKSEILFWGHIKVGEVTAGGNDRWYAYYRFDNSAAAFRTLRDFSAPDVAKAAVELALLIASKEAMGESNGL
jgi:hypothetical protein